MGLPSIYPTGVTIYKPEKCWNGYNLVQTIESGALLFDMNGNEVRRWDQFHGFPNKLLPNGNLIGHSGDRNPKYGMQDGLDLVQIDYDGNIVWKFEKFEFVEDEGEEPRWMARTHHDYQREGNPVGYYVPGQIPEVNKGNTLILAHQTLYNKKISDKKLLDDVFYEIDWEGNILWQWNANEHFEEIGFNEDAYVLIWTTTPWTLPANVAICLNENFDYGLYKTEKGNLILAKDLAESAFKDIGIENFELIKEFKGKDLEYTTYKHPFLERTGLVILGDHVTADAGTGAVHTAPGHGQDDYVVGLNYKLPVISPIDHRGCLTEEAGDLFKGLFYSDANKAIIKHLTETGHILKTQEISHSYPHDWRSKTPVIFRATEQWFIRMEGGDLREKTLKAIDKINFIPSWGKNRIGSMMETRPDWCISRQRVWGVPIPIFYNDETNEEIFHKKILDRICDLVRENGSNIWVEKTPEELIGEELLVKYNLKDLKLRKETNIMDVWFDSGSSHRGVLEVWEGLHRPCDLYLEGSDQHRGWFHTSLLTSVASTGDSPYKSVLTHGFVNDGEGRKMSKSLGNTVSPADVIKVYGADILRLWCGSVDYRDDVRISDNIIKQMSEAYRRIRNTARYILGNSYDFNPKTDKVAYKDMLEIDKWALNKLEVLKRNVTESYDKYEFYNLFQGIHYFAAIDMSAFYLDIIKDRLYTEKKDSVARRAAQTVMYEVLMTLTKMVAPILSFTAEEIWENLPAEAREAESVFLADWYVNNDEYLNPELDEKWQQIIKLRKEVNKKLEKARQGENKIIGNSLDAKVSLYTEDDALKEFIKENLELLETVFIVSDIEVTDSSDDNFTAAEEIENLKIKITHADGEKCERCWKYDELGSDSEHPTLCPRCAAVLK